MNKSTEAIILLNGSKTFWKTQTILKVFMILHKNEACLEVIAHDVAMEFEYNRLYLSSEMIKNKFDQRAVEDIFIEKMELKQNKKKDYATVMNEINIELLTKFVYVRLNQSVDTHGKKILTLQPCADDILKKSNSGNEQTMDILMEKPESVVPYTVELLKLSEPAVKQTLTNTRPNKTFKPSKVVLSSLTPHKPTNPKINGGTNATMAMLQPNSETSVPRQRWFKAVRKIITINVLQAMRTRLQSIFMSKTASKIVKRLRSITAGSKQLFSITFLTNKDNTSTKELNKNSSSSEFSLGTQLTDNEKIEFNSPQKQAIREKLSLSPHCTDKDKAALLAALYKNNMICETEFTIPEEYQTSATDNMLLYKHYSGQQQQKGTEKQVSPGKWNHLAVVKGLRVNTNIVYV